MRANLTIAALAFSSLFGTSCIVATSDPEPVSRSEYTGTLLVDWTIDGVRDADECDQGDAVWLRLSVFTSDGHHVADFSDSCDHFATSVELDPDAYYAEAVLEDADGNERTTPVTIDDFSILGRDSLSVPIDFPASSFY
jgi:hypothetical protein